MSTPSFLPQGLTIIAAAALRLVSPVLFMGRNIAGFVADVTIEESHSDELEITEHPVQQGAAITDHAYKRPATVVITCGYSNSSLSALGNPGYVQQVYAQFLVLQESRVLFNIVTGKRVYTDMLAKRIVTKTDKDNEYILVMQVECQQVIIANTETVSVPSKDQKNPSNTNPTTNRGNLAVSPVTSAPLPPIQ